MRQWNAAKQQIARLRSMLKKISADDYAYCEHCHRSGIPGSHQAALERALVDAMRHELDLLGIHRPGPAKAVSDRKVRQAYALELPAEPLAVQPGQSPKQPG